MKMNTWDVSLTSYGSGIVKWTKKNEFDEIDRKTSKVMTTNKELHLTSDIKKWYVSRAEGVRYM